MMLVPLASLANVQDASPTTRVSTGRPSEDAQVIDLDRAARFDGALPRASRSRAQLLAFERANEAGTVTTTTSTTAPPPPPTTARPKVVAASSAKPAAAPTTTAKPKPTTTTTAKPKPTTTTAPPPPATSAPTTTAPPVPEGNRQEGGASFHDYPDPRSCAHRSLPKGTILTVTNLANGKQTTCRIDDRGPFVEGRIVDLSKTAFSEIASLSAGVIRVSIEW
jgi:rare lipoprotein A